MAMPVPRELTTERLILRPGAPSDASVFRALWTERDPRVPPHRRIDADGRPTLAEVAAHLGADPGILTVVLRDTGEPIGYSGLVDRERGSADEPELVYELLRAHHGLGFATEAGRAIVEWARDAGCRRIWSDARAWNTASLRVLAKLGFVEQSVEPDPRYGDSVVVVLELSPKVS